MCVTEPNFWRLRMSEMCVAFLQPYKSTGGRRVEFPPYLGGRSWSANTDFFASMNSYLPPLIPFHQPTAACSVKWLFIVCHSVKPKPPFRQRVVHCVPFHQPTASYIPSNVHWSAIVCHLIGKIPPFRHQSTLLPIIRLLSRQKLCSALSVPLSSTMYYVQALF